ncbi:hypothetical protein [Streptomyces sp. JW3]|jgi:hypothetical protein|uniref:hypothetical protein n=1 Tax=Streptomyces sp. JW3 TaxID=3456955 RepID=UPI003FA4AD43
MAAAPHSGTATEPALPHPSRLGLVVWFVVQWVAIPVDFVVRSVWLLAVLFGGGTEDQLARLLEPFARFLSPAALSLRMSHRPAKHEAHLDRELARLTRELDQRSFSLRTRVAYSVAREVRSDGYLYRVGVHPRRYRGVPLSTVERLASVHGLALEASPDLRNGVVLRPVHAKDSW